MFFEQPIFFERNRVYRVYRGGRLFADFFGDEPEDGFYPEEWVASGVKALNEVSAGPKEGVSKLAGEDLYLDDALEQYAREILGEKKELGVLTKILDSAIRLPMQAHPDKAFAKAHFGALHGKEESWVILATRPGACVYYGFRDGVTRAEFDRAIDASETDPTAMERVAKSFPVKPGDVVYIPAKMLHAIGAGCLLLEVQEPTDFTVQPERLCGEKRLTDREMYMGLDRQDALDCFDYALTYPAPLARTPLERSDGMKKEGLIGKAQTTSFTVNSITLTGGRYGLTAPAAVYVVIDGAGLLTGDGYEKSVKKGDYFLLPARAAGAFALTGELTAIECFA